MRNDVFYYLLLIEMHRLHTHMHKGLRIVGIHRKESCLFQNKAMLVHIFYKN